MGSAAAYWLGKNKTLRTILLDQYSIGNDYCSSNDANRVFRYAYGSDKLYTRMAVESHQLWKTLEEETGQQLLIPVDLLLLDGEDGESNRFNEESHRTLTGMGLGAEKLQETELKKRFPQFSASGAFLDHHGGVLLASRILNTLSSAGKSQGVRILENQKATSLGFQPGPIVKTATGETIKCRKVIVAAGPWSNKLRSSSMAGITPTRQQVVYFGPRKGLDKFRPGSFPVFFADQYYGIPAVGVEGVKVSHKGVWDPVDPDSANRTVDPDAIETCRGVCRRFIPELADGGVVRTKVCLYDMTENSDFVIGRDPEHSEAIFGYGFSGHGFKFAPLVGKLLAELALDQPPSFDLERFSPSRAS